MNDVKSRLKAERNNLGLTQTEAAELGDVSMKTYQRYEAGTSEPSAVFLARLMRHGFDAVYIMSGTRQDSGIEKLLTRKAYELVKTYMALPEEDQELALLQVEAMFGKAVRDGRCEYVVKRKTEDDP